MRLKFISIFILSLLLFVEADDRAVRISTKLKNEQRVALVIGNNNYLGARLSKLINPINDAMAIKNLLQSKGFEVIYQEDGTKRGMEKSLDKFYNKINRGGVGFLYFSGHGIEVDGQNYLVPIDAKIDQKSETKYEAVSLSRITDRLQDSPNRLNIVVLDACRNDPFSRAAGKGGLAETTPRGLFVSFSTGAGSVASDGKAGENGLFTASLIKHMKKGLNLADVFKETRKDVFYSSNKRQFPAIYDQTIDGDFFFTSPSENSASSSWSETPPKSEYSPPPKRRESSSKSIHPNNRTFKEEMDDDFDSFMKDMQ